MEITYHGGKQSSPINSQKHWFHSRCPNPTPKTRLGGGTMDSDVKMWLKPKGQNLMELLHSSPISI